MGKGFSRTFKFVVLGTIIGWVSLASGHSVRAAGEADLVISRREGQQIYYSLNTTVLEDVLARIWDLFGTETTKGQSVT